MARARLSDLKRRVVKVLHRGLSGYLRRERDRLSLESTCLKERRIGKPIDIMVVVDADGRTRSTAFTFCLAGEEEGLVGRGDAWLCFPRLGVPLGLGLAMARGVRRDG